MAEKTILTCDRCASEGRVTEAVDRVRLVGTMSRRKGRLDVCADHGDALFGTSSKRSAKRSATVRTIASTHRCPVPGNDGYEGPGQGMFQHYRHNHPDIPYDDEAKAAAREAFDAAHPAKRRRSAA